MEKLLSSEQLSKILQTSLRTLAQWRERGMGPPYRLMTGTRDEIRYSSTDLEQWLEDIRVMPGPGNRPTPPHRRIVWPGLSEEQWLRLEAAIYASPCRRALLPTGRPGQSGEVVSLRDHIDTVLRYAAANGWPDADHKTLQRTNRLLDLWGIVFATLGQDENFPFSLVHSMHIIAGSIKANNGRRFMALDTYTIGKHPASGVRRGMTFALKAKTFR